MLWIQPEPTYPMQKESTGTTLNTDYKKIRENMRSKNKINWKKQKEEKKYNFSSIFYDLQ